MRALVLVFVWITAHQRPVFALIKQGYDSPQFFHFGKSILDLSPFPHLPFASARNPLEDALSELGISLDGLRDLTTSVCEAFSAEYRNHPSVSYFSVAGSGRLGPLPTAAAFLLFHHYIFARTGRPNDGLVTVDSATWGTFDAATWPADHADEVGHNLDNLLMPPAFPYLAKFDQIVSNVAVL